MKKGIIAIACFGLLMTSCGTSEVETAPVTTEIDTAQVAQEILLLKELNENLISSTSENAGNAAMSLYLAANKFVNNYPNHPKTPAVLELCAKSSEAMGEYEQTINILDKLIKEFPETEDTPKHMWNKARVYEEKMNNIEMAKKTFDEMIARFPNDPMAIEAQQYRDNFLGKSQDDILKMLDSINAPH